jgi:AcrR family transcriptional regulator
MDLSSDTERERTPNKQSISAARTRALIIDTACELIAEGGYDALTSAALADRAGLSKGGLYHHFAKMPDVVMAAYKKASMNVFGVLGSGRPKSFNEYLDEVEYVIFERLLKDPKSLRIISELYPRLMFNDTYMKARRDSFEKIMDKQSRNLNRSFATKIDQDQLKMAVNAVAVFVTGLTTQNREARSINTSKELWRWFRDALNAQIAATAKLN